MAACSTALSLIVATSTAARDGDATALTVSARAFMGNPHDVVVDRDTLAYTALDSGVAVYFVGDPVAPTLAGHLGLPSAALRLDVVGTLVFVAGDESGLMILDAADPTQMGLLGSLPTVGRARGVAVLGTLAVIAEADGSVAGGNGLRVVDVADPSAPVELSFLPLGNGAISVALAGSWAYVGLGASLPSSQHGLLMVDLSVPAAPAAVGFLQTQEPVNDIEVVGNTAYLATGLALRGALITVDVSAPAAPVALARRVLGDSARGVSVVDQRAFVAASALGLASFDVSNPAAPVLVDELPTGRLAQAVAALSSGVAVVAERTSDGAGGLTTVATPWPPQRMSDAGSAASAEATGVAVSSDTYLLLRRTELNTVDASNPAAPVLLGSWAPPAADFSSVAAQGTLAAVADGLRVRLVDLADPTAPSEVGAATLGCGFAVKPVLADPMLYVLNGEGYEVFDISNRAAPVSLGTYVTDGWASDLAVSGGLGYLVVGATLKILYLGEPPTPTLLGELSLPGQLYGVAAGGGLAVLTGLSAALYVVDVADPSQPGLRSTLPGGPGFAVELRDGIAAVAAGDRGIVLVDTGALPTPQLVAAYDTSGVAAALAGEGKTFVMATGAAQHWFFVCDVCDVAPACRIDAAVNAATSEVCEGTPVPLDAAATTVSGCPGGTLDYQWSEDGSAIPGATDPVYTVPGTHPPGTYRFTVSVSCRATPSCGGNSTPFSLLIHPATWPTIAGNSLMAVKLPGTGQAMSWAIAAGAGQSNVHRTLTKSDIPGLWADASTFVGTSAGTGYAEGYTPPASGVAHYQVYGRNSCDGSSVAP